MGGSDTVNDFAKINEIPKARINIFFFIRMLLVVTIIFMD